MSQLPKDNGSQSRKRSAFAASEFHQTPDLNDRFDRFCTTCGDVIQHLALERIPNQVCSRCRSKVDFLGQLDGIYNSCVRCVTIVRCTMKHCYMCGRANQYYDPQRPGRLEKALEGKLRVKINMEIKEEKVASQLSQECILDGDYDEQDHQSSLKKPSEAEQAPSLLKESENPPAAVVPSTSSASTTTASTTTTKTE